MANKLLTKLLCFTVSLTIVAGTAEVSFAEEGAPSPAEQGLYRLDSSGEYDTFTNYVHGYSLKVEPGMRVDMEYSAVCAVLENDHKRIEIYKESLPAGVSQYAYINYSDKFIHNTADHTKEYETWTTAGGRTVHILQWSRQRLTRVENDKNYYASLEILSGARDVYSIFVKSDTPFYLSGGYDYLIGDFVTFTPSQQALMRESRAADPESRGWNQETQDFYQQYFGPGSTLQWGIFEPKAPEDFNQLNYLEKSMGYQFPILLNYTNLDNAPMYPDLSTRLLSAYKNGRTLELTLQTPETDGGNMVYGVLDGEYDGFLRDYAKTVKDFGHPVLFRLGNEMNGDWCPYSGYNTSKDTLIFKEFYRYVHGIFEEVGADNVIWIWNPNGKSFPDFAWNDEAMYYPGDEYVDIVGLTAYNTGTYYSGENWTEFADLYDPIYAKATALYGQPLMITEFASSSVGGDKDQWVRNMFACIGSYPEIKVAVWWSGCDWDENGNIARPYFIDETPQLIQTFKELLKKPWYWDVMG